VKLKASIRFDSGGESKEEMAGSVFEEEAIVGMIPMSSSFSSDLTLCDEQLVKVVVRKGWRSA